MYRVIINGYKVYAFSCYALAKKFKEVNGGVLYERAFHQEYNK